MGPEDKLGQREKPRAKPLMAQRQQYRTCFLGGVDDDDAVERFLLKKNDPPWDPVLTDAASENDNGVRFERARSLIRHEF